MHKVSSNRVCKFLRDSPVVAEWEDAGDRGSIKDVLDLFYASAILSITSASSCLTLPYFIFTSLILRTLMESFYTNWFNSQDPNESSFNNGTRHVAF